MNRAIFISYRRKESLAPARAVYERLRSEFGAERVFIDLEGLDYGVDFVEVLEQQLAHCEVMLALVGPHWLGVDPLDGSRRIDDENDFVRVELRTALERKIRVVPVLVDAAVMPASRDLPDDLKALVRRQALELDFRRFDSDVGRLIGTLRKILDAPEPGGAPAAPAHDAASDKRGSATSSEPVRQSAEGRAGAPAPAPSGSKEAPATKGREQGPVESALKGDSTPAASSDSNHSNGSDALPPSVGPGPERSAYRLNIGLAVIGGLAALAVAIGLAGGQRPSPTAVASSPAEAVTPVRDEPTTAPGGNVKPPVPATGEPGLVVRIGHVAPTSGGMAHYGRDNENGARMAIDELNAKGVAIGGRSATFELFAEDDAADPKQGVAAAQNWSTRKSMVSWAT